MNLIYNKLKHKEVVENLLKCIFKELKINNLPSIKDRK